MPLVTTDADTAPPDSPWAPLRHPLFRWLWIASVVSQVGSFMTDVAQGWLMITLAASPFTIALLTTAESVPFFLLSLPAGALADVVDRRRLLITAQAAIVAVSAVLIAVTAAHLVTAAMLLALSGAMGVATALNGPAWFAVPAEILPRGELPAGIALNGAGYNVARVLGPALGGALVASAGPAAVFTLDAITTLGVVAVLVRWRRERSISVLPGERLVGAMKAGLRFAWHSPALRKVLLRGFAFIACACIVLALLPVLAREATRGTGNGPLAYGLLLGSLGLGAVTAAGILPWLRRRLPTDAIVGSGSWIFGVACVGLGFARDLWFMCPLLYVGGIAWMAVLSSLNVAAQNVSPSWVRARALAVYLLVFQAGVAGGSALWGAVADAWGLEVAFVAAGCGLGLGALLLARVRIGSDEARDLTPTRHWPEPVPVGEPDPDAGPVVVQLEYRIDPARAADFVRAARTLERIRRRDGAVEWWLLRDTEDAARYVEVFAVETWAEHLRQHERVSVADREVEEQVLAFHVGSARPATRHLISAASDAAAAGVRLPE